MNIEESLEGVTLLFLDSAPVIYFVEQHPHDKDSQDRDIEKAKGYWQAYQEEQDEQETEKP